MNRRTACTAVFALLASPRVIRAQVGGRKARIGFLAEAVLDQNAQRAAVEPFRRGLRELGYVEGQNIVIEFRSADGKYERLRELADELLHDLCGEAITAKPAQRLHTASTHSCHTPFSVEHSPSVQGDIGAATLHCMTSSARSSCDC